MILGQPARSVITGTVRSIFFSRLRAWRRVSRDAKLLLRLTERFDRFTDLSRAIVRISGIREGHSRSADSADRAADDHDATKWPR